MRDDRLRRLLDDARTDAPTPEMLAELLRLLRRRGLGLPRVSGVHGRMWAPCEDDSLGALDTVLDVVRGADRVVGVEITADRARFMLGSGRGLGGERIEGELDVLDTWVPAAGAPPRRLEVLGERDVLPLTYVIEKLAPELDSMPGWDGILATLELASGLAPLARGPAANDALTLVAPRLNDEVAARLRAARADEEGSLDELARALVRSAPDGRRVPTWADPTERLAWRVLDAVLDVVRGDERVIKVRSHGRRVVTLGLSSGIELDASHGPEGLLRARLEPGARLDLLADARPSRRPALFVLGGPLSDCVRGLPGFIDALEVGASLGADQEIAWRR